MEKPQSRIDRLVAHVEMLTRTIGEKSVETPGNLDRTAALLLRIYESFGYTTRLQTYAYHQRRVRNAIADISNSGARTPRYYGRFGGKSDVIFHHRR